MSIFSLLYTKATINIRYISNSEVLRKWLKKLNLPFSFKFFCSFNTAVLEDNGLLFSHVGIFAWQFFMSSDGHALIGNKANNLFNYQLIPLTPKMGSQSSTRDLWMYRHGLYITFPDSFRRYLARAGEHLTRSFLNGMSCAAGRFWPQFWQNNSWKQLPTWSWST